MRIEVRLFAGLRELAKQKAVMEDLPGGGTVADVISRLSDRFGQEFQKQVIGERGQPSELLRILVNGRNLASLEGVETRLKDGDVLAIFPPVAGGEVKIASYNGEDFRIEPDVYEPAEDTFLLAENLDVRRGERTLELGTGCGILAILAAKAGARVTATDINPAALECARANVAAHGVADRIGFRLGDLFEPVAGKRFNLVIFNPPYLPIPDQDSIGTPLDLAWEAGPDGRAVINRFLNELPEHLAPSSRALFVQSSLADVEKTIRALEAKGMRAEIVARRKLSFEELFLLRASASF
ncbi:MAG: MoaD family protein [Hadesarchaea archaeon]|nr:MoaD family protein [Hadesarchaea archaeon]